MFDKQKFATYLDKHAHNKFSGHCAEYVRDAIQAAGVDTSNHPYYAKDYGPFLLANGFHEVPFNGFYQAGDIAVIQPTPQGARDGISATAGHIAAYDGRQWVSDAFQTDVWGGKYRQDNLPIQIYRHD